MDVPINTLSVISSLAPCLQSLGQTLAHSCVLMKHSPWTNIPFLLVPPKIEKNIHNVLFTLIRIKRSSVLLLCLVRFNVNKTLLFIYGT